MDTNQIILIVMIVVGILFLVISLLLSAREKKTETEQAASELDINAYKQELEAEVNRLLDSRTQIAGEKLEASAKEAIDARVEEAKREIEVAVNEAKAYIEKLQEASQAKMEDCVRQTQEDTAGIADEVKQRIDEIGKTDVEQLKQDVDNVRGEIVERQKETEMLYTLVNDKQNQLIESIEQEQQKAQTLADTVETAAQRAQSFADASFSQEEPTAAKIQTAPESAKEQPLTEKEETAEPPQTVETSEELQPQPAKEAKAEESEQPAKEAKAEEPEQPAEEAKVEEPEQPAEEAENEEPEQPEESTEAAKEPELPEEEPAIKIEAEEPEQPEETSAEEKDQLLEEKAYAEQMEFDEMRPRRRRRKKRHFFQRNTETSEENDLTKPIDREEIRDALHAQAQRSAEAADEAEETAGAVREAESVEEGEIDIDEVVVADVEELESIATETVKEAVQEVLEEDEGLLGYEETAWEQDVDGEAAISGKSEAEASGETEDAGAQEAEAYEEADDSDKVTRRESRRGARRKKRSIVWELSKKGQKEQPDEAPAKKEETPQEESLPEDMVVEDEPNKMLHAVRSSGTVSTEADLKMRAEVLKMYDSGHSSMEIAEATGLGIGEVRMIVDLYSRRER